jgi:hypothetical protein
MRHRATPLPLVAIFGCLAMAATLLGGSPAAEATDPASPKTEPSQAPDGAAPNNPPMDSESQPKPPSSPELIALGDRVRQTLNAQFRQPPSTGENTPGELIDFCLAFGAKATVRHAGGPGGEINAIGCLGWNFPCAGYRLLRTDGEHVVARIGYGLQERPGELLAVLAQSGVRDDYELRVGDARRAVADLVAYEKLTCQSGTDLSGKLIGLAFYLDEDQPWKDETGQDWSLARMVEEELDRPVGVDDVEATDRLLGLSYALDRRVRRQQPVDGPFLRARDHTAEFRNYVLKLQNPDGSWHPRFFAVTGASSDSEGLLRSTGHILEWLALATPDAELDDPRLVRSVAYVTAILNQQASRRGSTSITPRQIAARMHALRALSVYNRRFFKAADAAKPSDS